MALLVDLEAVPEALTNRALDMFAKARAIGPVSGDGIWQPHENPWLREHVETVTARGQAYLDGMQNDLFAVFGLTPEPLQKAAPPWESWDDEALRREAARIAAIPPVQRTLDDWLAVCDLIMARYLPPGVVEIEADYLTVRAVLAGKIQAAMGAAVEAGAIATIMQALPTSAGEVPAIVLAPLEQTVLTYARARAAAQVSDLSDGARRRMRRMIVEHHEARALGQSDGTPGRLQSRLLDEFGALNRDWRRIAVTESGESCNQGYVAAHPPGSRLERVEAYTGACSWCRKIHGAIVTVVEPGKPDKDGEKEVWVGKTNYGRSASPRKRVGSALVHREPEELWWIAAGAQHPHCRGRWLLVAEKPAGASAEFDAWLDELISKANPNRQSGPRPGGE